MAKNNLASGLNRALNSFVEQWGDKFMELGDAAIEYIKIRTSRHESSDGNPFVPYSERYAKRKGVNQQSVDLFDSGDMLGSLIVLEGTSARSYGGIRSSAVRGARGFESMRDQTLTIGFTDVEQGKKAAAHHEGIGVPRRPFMALDDLWVQEGIDNAVRGIKLPDGTDRVEVRVL